MYSFHWQITRRMSCPPFTAYFNAHKTIEECTGAEAGVINLAKKIKSSGTEVSISSLISRGARLSEKGKKAKNELQEKCTAENFDFILRKNMNSKLDIFPNKLYPNKKGQGFLKGNFRKFINKYV